MFRTRKLKRKWEVMQLVRDTCEYYVCKLRQRKKLAPNELSFSEAKWATFTCIRSTHVCCPQLLISITTHFITNYWCGKKTRKNINKTKITQPRKSEVLPPLHWLSGPSYGQPGALTTSGIIGLALWTWSPVNNWCYNSEVYSEFLSILEEDVCAAI